MQLKIIEQKRALFCKRALWAGDKNSRHFTSYSSTAPLGPILATSTCPHLLLRSKSELKARGVPRWCNFWERCSSKSIPFFKGPALLEKFCGDKGKVLVFSSTRDALWWDSQHFWPENSPATFDQIFSSKHRDTVWR